MVQNVFLSYLICFSVMNSKIARNAGTRVRILKIDMGPMQYFRTSSAYKSCQKSPKFKKRTQKWLWRLWVMNLILSKHFSCYCHLLTYLWVDQVDQNCLDILGLSKEILLSFPFQSCYSSVFFSKDQMHVKNVTNR